VDLGIAKFLCSYTVKVLAFVRYHKLEYLLIGHLIFSDVYLVNAVIGQWP
jgi:hypothetical protein